MAGGGLSPLVPRVCAGLSEEPGPAGPGPVGLWLLDPTTVDGVDDDDADRARAWLDAEERARETAYARPDLARDHVLAHGFLRRVLGSVLGLPPQRVRLGREACLGCGGPHGRPVTDGVCFSLSHAGRLVLVAVSDRPVGCDVERHPATAEDAVELAVVLHPEERAEVEAVRDDPREAVVRFTRAWVRTEAHLKALGTGLLRDPALDRLGSDAEPVRHLPGWTVSDVVVPAGHEAAVCVADQPDEDART